MLTRVEAGATRAELPYVEALARAFAAQACQRLGREDDTRSYAEATLAFTAAYPNPLVELASRTALGMLENRSGAGLEQLQAAADLAREHSFRPWLVDLLLELGQHEEAERLMGELRGESAG